jgi:hypothetical protein
MLPGLLKIRLEAKDASSIPVVVEYALGTREAWFRSRQMECLQRLAIQTAMVVMSGMQTGFAVEQ